MRTNRVVQFCAQAGGAPVAFEIEDPATEGPLPSEFSAAISRFLALKPADRIAMTLPIWQNYQEILEAAGANVNVVGPDDIWRFVWPKHGSALRRSLSDDRTVYIRIDCDCGWEPEHGLQLVFKAGRELTRVSQFDGHVTDEDAWGMSKQ